MRRLRTADAGMVVGVGLALVTSAVAITVVLESQGVRPLAAPAAIALAQRPVHPAGAGSPSPSAAWPRGPRHPVQVRRVRNVSARASRSLSVLIVAPDRAVTEFGDLHDAPGDSDPTAAATPEPIETPSSHRVMATIVTAARTPAQRSATPRPTQRVAPADPADSSSSDRADPARDPVDPSPAARTPSAGLPTARPVPSRRPQASVTSTPSPNDAAPAPSVASPSASPTAPPDAADGSPTPGGGDG